MLGYVPDQEASKLLDMASHGIHSNFGDLQAVRDAAADANVNLGGVTAFGPHQVTFNIGKQMFEEMMQPNYETSVQMVWHYHGTLLQDSSKVFLFEPVALLVVGHSPPAQASEEQWANDGDTNN